jgi:hypothetical protein
MALHPQLDELIQRVLPVVQDFHRKGICAPHAATVDKAGVLAGRALTTDGTTQLSVAQAIEHFESSFAKQAALGEIQATGIFYHSPGLDTSSGRVSLPPATNTDECRALVALLEHAAGDSVYLLISYSGEPPSVEYAVGKLVEKPLEVFASQQSKVKKPWWKLW